MAVEEEKLILLEKLLCTGDCPEKVTWKQKHLPLLSSSINHTHENITFLTAMCSTTTDNKLIFAEGIL